VAMQDIGGQEEKPIAELIFFIQFGCVVILLLLPFHRIIEWPGLKRTVMIIEFQPPCYVQGHQSLDQAAQSHTQPGPKCFTWQ